MCVYDTLLLHVSEVQLVDATWTLLEHERELPYLSALQFRDCVHYSFSTLAGGWLSTCVYNSVTDE